MNLEHKKHRMLKWFRYRHLPEHLQEPSHQCSELAQRMVNIIDDGPELTAGLRKLLESKDCFVRAALEEKETKT